MALKNYYTILGIEQTASPDDIKKAYRKLAFKYHPDHNRGGFSGEERFKEIKEAYEVLTDPAQRKQLDANLKARHVYAPSYDFGKYTSPNPNVRHPFDMTKPANYNDGHSEENEEQAPKIRPWYSYIFLPIIFLIVSLILMRLITDPPAWLQQFLNGIKN